jgi:uncharacterized protein (TIGR02246 family)
MGDHPNAAAYRAAAHAFGQGDAETFANMLADDVVWHTIGGETLNGREAVAGAMSGLADVEFTLNVHDVLANDEHLVGLMEVHVEAGGQELAYRTAEIMHVSDGQITERWAFSDDAQAIVDFFNGLEA